jgi:ATP-dependent DNA helicase RecQ
MDECGACDNCTGETPPASLAPEGPPARRLRVGADRRERRTRDVSISAPTAAEEQLFERLRRVRTDLARSAGLPAYCVFPDRTLAELARRRPTSEEDLLDVPGVGPTKAARYGSAFLKVLEEE